MIISPVPHPNRLDKIKLRLDRNYLYPGQLCQTIAKVNAGIVHKIPSVEPYWKIMDYIYLKPGSTLKFLGLAKDLKFTGDVLPVHSVFETVSPLIYDDIISENISGSRPHLGAGDIVIFIPQDRQFISAAPQQ